MPGGKPEKLSKKLFSLLLFIGLFLFNFIWRSLLNQATFSHFKINIFLKKADNFL